MDSIDEIWMSFERGYFSTHPLTGAIRAENDLFNDMQTCYDVMHVYGALSDYYNRGYVNQDNSPYDNFCKCFKALISNHPDKHNKFAEMLAVQDRIVQNSRGIAAYIHRVYPGDGTGYFCYISEHLKSLFFTTTSDNIVDSVGVLQSSSKPAKATPEAAKAASKQPPKPRKEKIPKRLRDLVWKTKGSKICKICEHSEMDFDCFHCAHIVAEKHGGSCTLENLVPICFQCNLSMSDCNLIEWCLKHFPNSEYCRYEKVVEKKIDKSFSSVRSNFPSSSKEYKVPFDKLVMMLKNLKTKLTKYLNKTNGNRSYYLDTHMDESSQKLSEKNKTHYMFRQWGGSNNQGDRDVCMNNYFMVAYPMHTWDMTDPNLLNVLKDFGTAIDVSYAMI
jgi:HNH endonuclease